MSFLNSQDISKQESLKTLLFFILSEKRLLDSNSSFVKY